MFPASVDLDTVYLPALRILLAGGNPYSIPGFYNPPWVLIAYLPFAILPYDLGRALLVLYSIFSLGYTAHKFNVNPLAIVAIVLSPLAFNSLAWGNVEWFTLLGLALPSPLGLVLLAIKPQETICAMAFILWTLYRERGLKQLLIALAPVSIVFALSFWAYGFYPMRWAQYANEAGINLSIYPYGIVLGIALMWQAFKVRKLGFAIAASPLFFATLSPQVWLVEWLAVATLTQEVCLMTVSAWGVVIASKLGVA